VTQSNTTHRIGYLDAARGIAASMVMIYHYTGWKYPDNLYVKLSHLLFNGSDAVSFFFVLSGFVLAFPYIQSNRSLDLGKFYINRVYRIYPAFMIALVLNALFSNRNGIAQAPLDALWNTFGFKGARFWEEALLYRGRSVYLGLDWTLTIELIMSFFIPFLIAMTLFNKRLIVWFSLMSLLMTFMIGVFVTPFLLGMLVASFYHEIQSSDFKKTIWYRYRHLWLVLGFLFFSLRHIERLLPFHENVLYLMELFQLNFFMLSGIGSFIFLTFMIQSRSTQRLLEHPILIFLGKISYGIYLMHWVIVAAIFEYWNRITALFPSTTIAYLVMLVACIASTILLSTALYYWVELPFIQKGKALTKKMKETLVIGRK
jgi:peptidoglycan/LPS O-acetylase OafA/YrhL